jgi:outer membrane protein
VSQGLAAEKTLDASLRLNQILFSESALANLSVQKKLQVALEAQQRTLELDIVQQAVNTYLNVLKARTQLDVEKNGLRLAQSNLQLAKSRVAAGKADASDVSRWESEIATARQRVLLARSGAEQFRDKLNRLLRRPLKDRFPLQPAGLDDPSS